MNSVELANIVWDEIKGYSVVPTLPLLKEVIARKVGFDTEKHVIQNAYDRVVKKMEEVDVLYRLLDGKDFSTPLSQSTLKRIEVMMKEPIRPGPI